MIKSEIMSKLDLDPHSRIQMKIMKYYLKL